MHPFSTIMVWSTCILVKTYRNLVMFFGILSRDVLRY